MRSAQMARIVIDETQDQCSTHRLLNRRQGQERLGQGSRGWRDCDWTERQEARHDGHRHDMRRMRRQGRGWHRQQRHDGTEVALLDGHADVVGRSIITGSVEDDGDGSDLAGRGDAANMERRDQRHHQNAEKPQECCGLRQDGKRGNATVHGAE